MIHVNRYSDIRNNGDGTNDNNNHNDNNHNDFHDNSNNDSNNKNTNEAPEGLPVTCSCRAMPSLRAPHSNLP